ncbi:MAG: hypothetical protein JWQ09_425 [Segetibacter sp.]|nr:hypothetical protein [Segetibacter sp.]
MQINIPLYRLCFKNHMSKGFYGVLGFQKMKSE